MLAILLNKFAVFLNCLTRREGYGIIVRMIERYRSSREFSHGKLDVDFHVWNHTRTALHTHDYCEIFLVTKGPLSYLINDMQYELPQNTLSFVRPNDVHQFLLSDAAEQQHLNIAARPEVMQKLCDFLNPLLFDRLMQSHSAVFVRIDDTDFANLQYLAGRINLCDASNDAAYAAELSTLLFNALSLFNRYIASLENSYPAWLEELLSKLHSSAWLGRSISDLYDESNYSPPMLIAAFKKHLGVTPVQYITKLKIVHACNLLKNSDYSTLAVATLIGYDSLSHFNHVFKTYMGVTPGQYRKAYRTHGG